MSRPERVALAKILEIAKHWRDWGTFTHPTMEEAFRDIAKLAAEGLGDPSVADLERMLANAKSLNPSL